MKNGPTPRVFTIGHSNQSSGRFLELLNSQDVQVLVDVRSQPYSKYAKHFDHERLKALVINAGIRYLYLGRELGGRPQEKEFCGADGHILYGRVASAPRFQEGLLRLERGIHQFCVALLCAEENPAFCHRRLLLERGIQVEHIRGDGRIQTDQEVEAESGVARNQLSLFQESGVSGERGRRASARAMALVKRAAQL